jgi:hypothetical protein
MQYQFHLLVFKRVSIATSGGDGSRNGNRPKVSGLPPTLEKIHSRSQYQPFGVRVMKQVPGAQDLEYFR